MALDAGTRLGPYEIVSPAGAGGMGEVYRAKDTRLDRTVAIKILPSHLSENPELRERFEREARTVSSLNHPHICTLHDIGHQDGVDYLVMEYLEGESLADRLERGALSTNEVLRYGIEIVDALDEAHRQGVVHRDLKPGNIMLTPSGAKLVDFGLAKLQEQEAAREMSSLPTQHKPLTEQGSLLGTFQYMAPEQLEGKEADPRSDLFALGAVLYEMVTGRKAFEGKSQASLISAIMSSEPPSMTELEPLSPKSLERIVRRCLEKDPDKRWQSAEGVLDALRFLAEEGEESDKTTSTPVATRKKVVIWSTLGLGLGALLAGVAVWSAMRPEPPTVKRFVMNLAEGEQIGEGPGHRIAISPDGERVVYLTRRDSLMLRAMDQIEARPLAGTERARHPFFSPDGEWLGFFAGGKLKKLSLSGGAPLTLADVDNPAYAGAVWGSDDMIVYNVGSDLLRVPAAGGASELLLASETGTYKWPESLPGGDAVLYTVWGGSLESAAIAVFSETSGESRVLVEPGTHPIYTTSGHIVFARAPNALWAVPFDLSRLDITGSAFPVLENVALYAAGGASNFGVSHDGTLVYVPHASAGGASTIVSVDRQGLARPLIEARRAYGNPRLSPDGTRLALEIFGESSWDVWVLEMARETLTRLTFEGDNGQPIWTPDGSTITFGSSIRSGAVYDILSKPADGSGDAVPLTANDYVEVPASWAPDGKTLVVRYRPGNSGDDIGRLSVDGDGETETVVGTRYDERHVALSRDGRWLAYSSNESGRPEVYVRPFPETGGRWQVSTDGGTEPVWAWSGNELFFRTEQGMWSVPIASEPTFTPGEPVLLFEDVFARHVSQAAYDVTSDDQRFVMILQDRGESVLQIHVDLNWLEELKRSR